MKETLIKLGTGLVAKIIRYALTGIGGTAIATSTPDGKPVEIDNLAAGIVSILVALGWSVWEDRVKKTQPKKEP